MSGKGGLAYVHAVSCPLHGRGGDSRGTPVRGAKGSAEPCNAV
ncbi:hypothetical protein ppKF707_0074 [Metapseudomonas furukawaii]|uniref:Uncharacterized protein n=1 Tax=Metapseudomonas furukawaii TaxID=1149133 RepID=A0AAD1FHB4_METFU|nr:hypothetical protein ppKF707_0074 [Pseudomonas furukawaii]BAU76436.1 hypothetical protein KF707C_47480 [Pseudomonas furukawaii]